MERGRARAEREDEAGELQRLRPARLRVGPASYPGFYPYDDLVRRATNLGFGIIITITGDAPRWATEGGLGTTFETANRRVIASEYAQFAAAVAKRYSGDLPDLPPVRYFSIWNEPNHRNFMKPTKEAPQHLPQPGERRDPADPRERGARTRRSSSASSRPVGPRAARRWARPSSSASGCASTSASSAPRSGAGCSSFKKIAAQGFAHHPYGPTERVPKTRDVINMLAIRQLGKYLDQAARAGPHHGEAADLQHRVRPAEQPAGPARQHEPRRARPR